MAFWKRTLHFERDVFRKAEIVIADTHLILMAPVILLMGAALMTALSRSAVKGDERRLRPVRVRADRFNRR